MKLILRSSLFCVAFALGAGAADAAKKDKETAAVKPELVGSFGDWKVFHSGAGKGRICYLLAEPKTRDPDSEKRDKAYAFISERPSEKVRNEISFVMGFEVGAAEAKDVKDPKDKKKPKHVEDSANPVAAIGEEEFDLIPRGNDVWVKNPAEEGKVIEEMRKGVSLIIKAAAKHGHLTTDTYSLSGFSQAVDKALKDCPAN